MGLRVNTNIASLTAQRHMQVVTRRLGENYARLASGLRIATAADDAAGLAISERMRAQIRSFSVAGRNALDGISLAQTAEGALNEVSNILSRMRELSMQSTNGTLGDDDRATLNEEFSALIDEIGRVAEQTTFNGIKLLNGDVAETLIQVGINADQNISITNQNIEVGVDGLDIEDLEILTADDANLALAELDVAINTVNTARGNLGAAQNRMQSALASILNARENLSAAESRIRDVDVASETAELTKNSIMQQAAVSILQQANVQPQIALSLLQG